MHGLLTDIGVAVLAATVLGLIAHFLRQPVILGYLIAGAIVGPVGWGFVHELGNIQTISEIGLVLLLFIIGLEMNLAQVMASGRQLLVAGFGQFPLGVLLGLAFFPLLGLGLFGTDKSGLYFALVCGLSSTAIVVKLLYDKFELDTAPGRMTVGILVIQDIFAILVLAFQPNLANPDPWPILKALGGAAVLLGAGFLLSKLVLSRIFQAIASQPELVVATSIGWCAAVAGGAGALGLSKEMGALVAGLSISAFPYALHVTAKTLPLRDFFLTLFFVSLGMQIQVPQWAMAGSIVALVAFTIVSRFATVIPLLLWSGAGLRTSVITSLNLAQISEFGLVIAALGVTYQHIGQDTFLTILYAMAITAVLSSYGIRWSHPIYNAVERLLGRAPTAAPADGDGQLRDIVLLGHHRTAAALVERIERERPELVPRLQVVDFSPATLAKLKERGIHGTFGDLGSMDTLHHAHVEHATLIISTIPDMLLKGVDNRSLARTCRALAPQAVIVVTADSDEAAKAAIEAGANEAINPHRLAGDRLTQLLPG